MELKRKITQNKLWKSGINGKPGKYSSESLGK